jgi:methylenetetrahydrofolate reductase (NADPH)
MGQLQEKLAQHQRVITAEISPPKGAGVKKLKENIALLKPWVTAINVTDCQRALVRMASWAVCKILLDSGAEPVFQLTCRDRNSIALQSDLMGASALGIPNLLCLTGDPVKVGDSPDSKSVFELESLKLLQLVSKLQKGRDSHELKMNAPTRFFVGAVVNPTLKGSNGQLERMKKKIGHGASFFQTQANYDIDDFASFLKSAQEFQVPVLAGILILHSAEVANYIRANLPGIQMPDEIAVQLNNSKDQEAEGIQIAVNSMLKLEHLCAGFHLMTIRQESLIPKVVEQYYAKSTLKNPSL